MAEISWIKLKTTMFDDEKIRLIQSLPEADAILVIWIRLLVLAGKTNDDGLIYIQRNMPYTEEMLATLFDKPVSVVRLALVTLQQFEMVDLGEDGLIAISNWEKHQNIEGMDKIREQNRLRKARQREKQKLLTDVTGRSRDSHAIDKELDKDIDKELDKDILSCSDKQDDVPYKKIIDYLNLKAKRDYKHSTQKTKTLIRSRWNEGFKLEDFKQVIDNKCFDWSADSKMSKFLRPQTLFGTNFESYLNENKITTTGGADNDGRYSKLF